MATDQPASGRKGLIIIMGPAGAGKSTVSAALSEIYGWPMIEGDDYHPQANRDKQAAGIPLTDKDRAEWLDNLIRAANATEAAWLVLACSALTPYVQTRLAGEIHRSCHWMLLSLPKEVLRARLEARTGHFMPASLLEDQLSALVPPPDAIEIPANRAVGAICVEIFRLLNEDT